MSNVINLGMARPYHYQSIREYDPAECCGHYIALVRAEDGTYAVLIVSNNTFEVIGRYPNTPSGATDAVAAAEVADTTLAMHTFIQPEA